MKRNLNRFFLSAIILSALAFGFQNCGEASHVANPDPNEQAQFFAYSYSTNPNFLVSMNLFRPTGAIANLTSFKYFHI